MLLELWQGEVPVLGIEIILAVFFLLLRLANELASVCESRGLT